ncbi:hypothetical protein, partial [Microvirga massiliensis]|uniref:hypothetical protein n=1 Tax=Microvirga massiliensis TaxID=1033741 RepID=UPI00065FA2DB
AARDPGQKIVILVLTFALDEQALGKEGAEVAGKDAEIGGGAGVIARRREGSGGRLAGHYATHIFVS